MDVEHQKGRIDESYLDPRTNMVSLWGAPEVSRDTLDPEMRSHAVRIDCGDADVIRPGAVRFYPRLESIDAAHVVDIEHDAVGNCPDLRTLRAPEARVVGAHALASNPALTNVHLPSCKTVGRGAFKGCESLESLCLPKCTHIDQGAFEGCTSLQKVVVPKGCHIDEEAFDHPCRVSHDLMGERTLCVEAQTVTPEGTYRTELTHLSLLTETDEIVVECDLSPHDGSSDSKLYLSDVSDLIQDVLDMTDKLVCPDPDATLPALEAAGIHVPRGIPVTDRSEEPERARSL